MAKPIVDGCVVGEFGKTIIVTCKDTEGTVQNISSYGGTKEMKFKSPKGNKAVTCTASFVTDGSDGKLSWSFAEGSLVESGDWEGTAVLNDSGATMRAKSYPFILRVEETLG